MINEMFLDYLLSQFASRDPQHILACEQMSLFKDGKVSLKLHILP